MKTSKFSETQIAFVLKRAEDGTPVAEVCRKAGIAEATFYNWRKRYAWPMCSEVKRLRQLEDENTKLKRIVADLSLDKAMLQDVLFKNSDSKVPRTGDRILLSEALGRERGEVGGRRRAGQQFGNEFAGGGGQGETETAVPKSIDDIGCGARVADRG